MNGRRAALPLFFKTNTALGEGWWRKIGGGVKIGGGGGSLTSVI